MRHKELLVWDWFNLFCKIIYLQLHPFFFLQVTLLHSSWWLHKFYCVYRPQSSIHFFGWQTCIFLSLAIVNKHLSQQIQKLAQPKRTNLTIPLIVIDNQTIPQLRVSVHSKLSTKVIPCSLRHGILEFLCVETKKSTVNSFFICCICFRDSVSYISGWLWTCGVAKDDFEFLILLLLLPK